MLPSGKQYRESMKTLETRSFPRIGLPIQMFRTIRSVSVLGRILRERMIAVGQARVIVGIYASRQFSFCSEIEHRHWIEQCSVPLAY